MVILRPAIRDGVSPAPPGDFVTPLRDRRFDAPIAEPTRQSTLRFRIIFEVFERGLADEISIEPKSPPAIQVSGRGDEWGRSEWGGDRKRPARAGKAEGGKEFRSCRSYRVNVVRSSIR